MIDWSIIKHFKPAEFACKCGKCGQNLIKPELVYMLESMRAELNIPLLINSGYRCPAWNKQVGGVSNSPHITGLAADIACNSGHTRLKIIEWLIMNRVQRIGIYPSFIHADLCKDKPLNIWLG